MFNHQGTKNDSTELEDGIFKHAVVSINWSSTSNIY